MSLNPKVSILCVSMNHENFIIKTIQSILDQSYKNIEILYLDNFSMDKSYERGKNLLKNCSIPYQTFKRASNFSISENLNFLISKSRGENICCISCDDWMHPDNVLYKVEYLNSNPMVGMVYCNGYFFINETSKYVKIYNNEERISQYSSLLIENNISAPATVIRRSVIDEVGDFDERSNIEDWDMWIRIAKKYKIGYIDEPLIYYRLSEQNISKNVEYMWQGFYYIFKKYQKEYKASDQKNKIYENYFKRHSRYIVYLSEETPKWKSFHMLLKYPILKTYYFKALLLLPLMILFSKKRLIFKSKV